ncbi:MAG: lipid-A-disaccharide synthase [Gammaproteobacteria bacterium]
MRLAVVAAEPSGDRLGAGVLTALRQIYQDVDVQGIGGPEMTRLGLNSLCDIHDLSVMGVEDLFRKLPRALAVRRRLLADLLADPPDIFLGIDSPDFNLSLEKRLRQAKIPTAHLVSPTVWAWRSYRLRKIRNAVDQMLVLFPFEETFYRDRNVPAVCVGHPAAREIAGLEWGAARRALHIDPDATIVAVLPGSRESEVKRLGSIFIETIKRVSERRPDARFIVPLASERMRDVLTETVPLEPVKHKVTLLDGRAREVLAASDVALLASGTAALEAALAGTPMVVAYRVSWSSYGLARLLAKTNKVSMPNHLLPEPIIPEFLQTRATPSAIAMALLDLLTDHNKSQAISSSLRAIRDTLDLDTNRLVAEAIAELSRASRKP